MWNLMQFLGFDGEDDYEEPEEYETQPARNTRKQKQQRESQQGTPELILFRGVPSEGNRYQLSEALKKGSMILIDLHDLDDREMEDKGEPFITFMNGVAYARGGRIMFIEPAQYLVMPRDGMFQEWVEEGRENDGTFNRQGR